MSSQPIPVEQARSLGQQYGKDIVVILAYDHETAQTNTVTWGRSPEDKENAVNVRDQCIKDIGLDGAKKTTHEDYRFIAEGERAQIVDQLTRACRTAQLTLESVLTEQELQDPILINTLNTVRAALSQTSGRD